MAVIGLIGCDMPRSGAKFPNLVLMKLSTYYKSQGYETRLLHPSDITDGGNMFEPYERLVGACVFSWNQHIADDLEQHFGVVMGWYGEH